MAEFINGEVTRDRWHTYDVLYDYRMAYHIQSIRYWDTLGIRTVKSELHSDGEKCFGGDYFIVVSELLTGQVSNHYKKEHWGLFDVPAREFSYPYDEHTPAIALARIMEFGKLGIYFNKEALTRAVTIRNVGLGYV